MQLADLLVAVTGVGPGTSLVDKVKQIQGYVGAGDTTAACTALNSFLGLVAAQNGKKLSVEQAQLLSAEMAKISVALSCPAGTFSVTKASIPTAAPRMSSRH